MKITSFIPMLSLQIFAEGAGDGGAAQGTGATAGAAAQQTKGATSNPLADVKYGIQEEAAPAAEVQQTTDVQTDPEAEFEKLIKGQYKAQYDARMQDTIRSRLKSSRETVEKYNALAPTLEMLGKKYGVHYTNIAKKALQTGKSVYDLVLEEGILTKEDLDTILDPKNMVRPVKLDIKPLK